MHKYLHVDLYIVYLDVDRFLRYNISTMREEVPIFEASGRCQMAEKTEAQKRAQRKYMQSRATIQLVTTPERRDFIKAHAMKQDGGSVNAFINRAIDNQIALDNAEQ